VRYRILGPLGLATADGGSVRLGPKLRRLLAALLLHADEAVTVHQLAVCLWGEDPPQDPRPALQVHVVRLRRHLGEDLRTTASGYALTVQPGELDAAVFEHRVGQARTLAADGLAVDAARVLEEALGLWHGEPVEGLDGPGFDEPVRRLQRLRRQAEDDHADLVLTLGEGAGLLGVLEERIAADPTRVRAWEQLARVLVGVGRWAAAAELQATARSLGLHLPDAGTEPGRGETPSGPVAGAGERDHLRADLRALLTSARPHALPSSVLHLATGQPAAVVDAALRQDPATIQSGRPPTWRLRDDVGGAFGPDTTDRLNAAAVADAAVAGAGLLGPDMRAAAATCRALAPLLEAGLRAGTRSLATIAAMGRWWSMEGRADLGRLAAAAVLDGSRADLFEWLDAHGWALDLAGRVGDGRIVELLIDALPPAPDEPRAAALWTTTQGHASEVAQDIERAQAWFLDAADRWRDVGDGAAEIACCCNAAHAARERGEHDLSRRLIERARALPVAAVAPLPRHFVMATDATLRFDVGDVGEARDLALSAEVLVRGVADRLADRVAVLAAEAAFFRHDHAEVRISLARAAATPDARIRLLVDMVRAEVEQAEGHRARAVRALESLWARDGDLLRLGLGSILAGTYARIAAGLGRTDLAAALLTGTDRAPGPWGRLDDELRRELDVPPGPTTRSTEDVLVVVRRAREELVAAVSTGSESSRGPGHDEA
jgi:DNA-binding SARP family transcriptional activator